MKLETYQGASVEEAIAAAKEGLQVSDIPMEDVKVLQEPKKGFFGFGSQPAIIQVSLADDEPSVDEIVAEVAGEAETVTDPAADKEPATTEVFEEATVVEALDDSQSAISEASSDSQVADTLDSQSASPADASASADLEPVENQSEPASQSLAADYSESDSQSQDADEEDDEEASYPFDWGVEDVAHYLIDVMEAYLVDVTIDVEDMDDLIIFHINTDKPGLVIGKHGKIINSLETLAQILTHSHVRKRVAVEVNVGDYRERREQTLEKLAERTADQVTVEREDVTLSPLPARERKIIHRCLSKYSHIKTQSQGRDPHRYMVVSYKD
ncbi:MULTISPECIES: RNA-binding cell elongation regulator Jag/EloR [Aerococcus]|uniref:RNA-binding protein KhpB n=1 Tax=Aerococcus loyolae TaxID=2976809 RepID=A0ABT4BXQ4_9LACT|nr:MULTISPECIES: RNA-binding cell elongation regulator Jag/EloR [Aerococcus]KAA9220693.1 KH domain-containing protein [Aerococcus loyolae]KAA9265414.1 KH domain-containing protein [Aerococcus loyolae]MCY3025047.1 Jag N-terminal domain-containing protein [Aerococcus loyolae]MCY3026896.1 Jag N-terminal domain-containing protein [Aerococcus loyolae]MCY3028481.1 Jag N-terminal domain-containing protein [Aerococcus loyolae]